MRTELGFRAPLPLVPPAPHGAARPGADAGPVYDLHGLVAIQGPAWAGLDRRFGPFAGDRPADLSIVEAALDRGEPTTRWGGGVAPGSPPLALDPAGRRAELDVDAWLADRAVLRAEPGFRPGDLVARVLLPALRTRLALRSGAALLRASAYRLDGQTVAVAGWTGSGKTTALIEALRRGAQYLGDEWVILDEHGVVYPFTAGFSANDRILLEHPDLRRRLPARARAGLAVRRGVRGALLGLAGDRGGAGARGVRWMAEVAMGTAWHRGTVAQLLPETRIAPPSRLDVLVDLDPGPGDLVRRLVSPAAFETARDRAALERFGTDEQVEALHRADRAERDVVAAALGRVRVVGRSALPGASPGGSGRARP